MQGFTRITAPESGIVTDKKIDVGSMAMPGVPFLIIESTGDYHVEASVDEALLGLLKKGVDVDVGIDSLGKEIRGRIRELVPSIDPQSRTFLIKIGLSGSGLRSGLFARVRIPAGVRECLLVPEKAIVNKGQLTGVYVFDDKGLITYRVIKKGKRYGNTVEVLTGLKAGEKVIVEGVDKAIDGALLVIESKRG